MRSSVTGVTVALCQLTQTRLPTLVMLRARMTVSRREEQDMHKHPAHSTPTRRRVTIVIAFGMLIALVVTSDSILASSSVATATSTEASSDDVIVSDAAPELPLLTNIAYGPLAEQRFDVHLPTNRPGPFPVMIYLHSGGWVAGSRVFVPDFLLQEVDRAGMALVSIDYRLVTTAPDGSFVNSFPVPNQDVDRAIRFVKAHAAIWNLDPSRVVIAGASAGGHLAALAGAAPGTFMDPTLPADLVVVSPRVDGVLDFVGVSDFTTFGRAGGWAPPLMAAYLNCPSGRYDLCDPAKIEAASVAPHVGADAPPAFFVYGTEDTLVEPATQGVPLALTWANAREEASTPLPAHGVELEQVGCGHNVEASDVDMAALEAWIDGVFANPTSTMTLARAAHGRPVTALPAQFN
jgi:acetyl esterase/lipase